MANKEVAVQEEKKDVNILRKNKKDIKDLIAPSGIDATSTNHIEIVSNNTKYARSMIVSLLPRMCTFPEFLRGMYNFGDINVSIFINPISEAKSQTELNRTINTLESERIVAADRGNINRESMLAQKRAEAEELRDAIASGLDKLFEASIICTLFAYDMDELDRQTELLSSEMSKTLKKKKNAWALQEEAFKTNLPLGEITPLIVDQWQRFSHLLIQMLDMKQEFQLDLIDKQDYLYCLITLAQLYQTITWLFSVSLVLVKVLQLKLL